MATGEIEGEEESMNKKINARKNPNKPKNPSCVPQQSSLRTLVTTDDNNSSQKQPLQTHDSSSRNGIGTAGYVRYDNLVKLNLNVLSRNEVKTLKRKLASELEQVRNLVRKFEAKESRFSRGYGNSQVLGNDNVGRDGGSLARVNSDVGSVGLPSSRPHHGSSVLVSEHDHNNRGGGGGGGSEFLDKEKKTPKANQLKSKPMESNKKMKPNVGKNSGGRMGGGIQTEKFTDLLLKSCSDLLGKLMKHKFGWVFNKPVDVKGLGLHDYYTIVKHPMDLGTVKTRLNKKWYRSPRDFAEDVKRTFTNAMLYNPKGQDVHFMAETLLGIFEENWAAIESEYNLNKRPERSHDYSLSTPTSRKTPASAPVQAHAPPTPTPAPLPYETRTVDRSESMTMPVHPKPRAVDLTPTGTIAVPKKRTMTYEEKQTLSVNLQNLPSEKLENVVQIIKKSNPALFQQEDEIELEIDSVDPETLWELDRFVTNYMKSLSKIERKAEIALQENAEDDRTLQETNLRSPAEEIPKVAKTADRNVPASPQLRGERLQNNEIGSSSSSSSSSGSGSGSSSSDSDSDSSHG